MYAYMHIKSLENIYIGYIYMFSIVYLFVICALYVLYICKWVQIGANACFVAYHQGRWT